MQTVTKSIVIRQTIYFVRVKLLMCELVVFQFIGGLYLVFIPAAGDDDRVKAKFVQILSPGSYTVASRKI